MRCACEIIQLENNSPNVCVFDSFVGGQPPLVVSAAIRACTASSAHRSGAATSLNPARQPGRGRRGLHSSIRRASQGTPEVGQHGEMGRAQRPWRWRRSSAEGDRGLLLFLRENRGIMFGCGSDIFCWIFLARCGEVCGQNIRSRPFIFQADHQRNLGRMCK